MRSVVGFLLALAVCAGCAKAPCERQPPARLQLLSVNDVYRLDPDAAGRGGLARVATLVRGLRRETPDTIFALAGDTISPSLLSSILRGKHMIEAWNALGLDAATFGNHEFDFGPDVLRERMGESRFLWISANVFELPGGRLFGGARRWLRRDIGGLRVGMIGLTTPETARTSNGGPTVQFEGVEGAARAAFADMGPVDVRVALTHLPLRQDRSLAQSVPLHAILGGHDHDPMLVDQGSTVIVKAGADAVNVGQIEYALGCGGKVVERRQRLIPVDATVVEAPDVAELVRRYAALTERELDVRVGQSSVPLDARETVIRREQTALGHFLAEAMRRRVGAEVALLNSGAIRGNRLIPAGPLTRRDLHELLPFNNTVALLELTGEALAQALEHSVDALPRPAGHFLQVAGMTSSTDAAKPVGQRVSDIRIGGRPLEARRRYRVAVPDYLARGQDDYPMLARAHVLLGPEDGPGLVDTVLQAVVQGRSP